MAERKTNSRSLANGIFLALLALVSLWFLSREGGLGLLTGARGDELVRQSIPLRHELEQLGLDLRLLAGQREQGGIYISDQILMRKLESPNEQYIQENSDAIREFSRDLAEINIQNHTYLAIIPTAAGVMTQHLPRYAESQMPDQQRFIELLYASVTDSVFTVDVYSPLQSRRNQYVYYRTEDNLTALGGYYVYTAMARRLGEADRSLSQFDIEYADHAHYGDLYRTPKGAGDAASTAPYRKVPPDTLSLYRYGRTPREYAVTHHSAGEERVYHSLYPLHRLELDNKMDVYFGGMSSIVDFELTSPVKKKLLVFGDKTALSYLPFLVNHYQQVTLVNLQQLSATDYRLIRPLEYDDVLFAFSIDTYIHSASPAKVGQFEWNAAAPS